MSPSHRGALIAVCGIGQNAQPAQISRLVAGELTRRVPEGAVLLTACDPQSPAGGLRSSLERHLVVVADLGLVRDLEHDAVRQAAAVVCAVDAHSDPLDATTVVRTCAEASRFVAVVTTDSNTTLTHVRRIAAGLPLSTRAIALVPSAESGIQGNPSCAAAAVMTALR